jgi:dephospho-CoA kinase
MLVIGLTGGIGSGKTTVANLFAKLGVNIIDTDIISRDLTQPGQAALTQIAEHFGQSILSADGKLDRTQLRECIFKDPDQRAWLEQLLHPLIRTEMAKQVKAAHSPYCIAVIPLLFETSPNPLITRTLVVDAPPELQLSRTQQRDNRPAEEVSSIIKSQMNREKRLSLADDVIINSSSLSELKEQVQSLHMYYLTLAHRH